MTHQGAIRDHNEDALAVGPLTICGVSQQDPVTCELPLSSPTVVAVADGMGGHAAGEQAAAHTVRTLATTTPQTPTELTTTLARIDEDLVSVADPTIAGLGTTVAGVLLTPDGDTHFHAGDSRVYLAHGGYLAQVSEDDRGPTGGLTQCLGGRTDRSPLRCTVAPLQTADRVLLCSDGLSDLVPLEAMEELLKGRDPGRVAKSLWAAAMNASGHDNITVALIERAS